jgi:lysophospholipid acyltransferase (LPLAT)-like uncharacterized protein
MYKNTCAKFKILIPFTQKKIYMSETLIDASKEDDLEVNREN